MSVASSGYIMEKKPEIIPVEKIVETKPVGEAKVETKPVGAPKVETGNLDIFAKTEEVEK